MQFRCKFDELRYKVDQHICSLDGWSPSSTYQKLLTLWWVGKFMGGVNSRWGKVIGGENQGGVKSWVG